MIGRMEWTDWDKLETSEDRMQQDELENNLETFDRDELPVSPTIKVIKKYSEDSTLPDLSPEELLDWQEMAYQLFKKDYEAVADLGRIKTKARLIVKSLKIEETEYIDSHNEKRTKFRYIGDIKYKIYTVKQEQKAPDYRNFEKINGVEVDISAFNTIDFKRQMQMPRFNKFGYKIGKLKEKLLDAVIAYSVFVESSTPNPESIERAKQKLLAIYDICREAIQDYYRKSPF